MSILTPSRWRLKIAHALWVLRLLPPKTLPDVATSALEEGFDSPSLRRLAVADDDDDRAALFNAVTAELGLRPMTPDDAVGEYALWVCKQISRGELAPYEGAKAIWDATLQLDTSPPKTLHPFIYAASEWQDRPPDRPFFEDAVRTHALQLVREAERAH